MTNKFVVGDRVRHIGGTVEGTTECDADALLGGLISVTWDDSGYTCAARIDALELAPVPTPPAPKPPETLSREAEIAMGMMPYREWSASLTTAKIDASDSFKIKSMIDYARWIPATAPFASLIFDLANFLEDATKNNPCTGAFCTFDPRESCEICDKGQDEHAPRSWDGDRSKIRCGDQIYIGVGQPRLVVAATKDGIYYVDSRGVTVCLRDHQEIMGVERVGRNGWKDVDSGE